MEIPVGFIENGQLQFDSSEDLNRAWDLGVFYIKRQSTMNINKARSFCNDLVMPENPYRKIPKLGELEGFISLENNQQTKIALQRKHWDEYYPADIAEFGRELDGIGIVIVNEVLKQSGIPEKLWEKASGGYSTGEGNSFLNFVYYDTTKSDLGLRPHTDYGFVTILDATAPGLQIEVEGVFRDVPVKEDHFIINFGEALNYITANSEREVGAIRHQVTCQKSENPIRKSVVYFGNPDLDSMLYQLNSNGDSANQSTVLDLFAELEQRLTQ